MGQAVPAVLINLDRSADRLAHIKREFAGSFVSGMCPSEDIAQHQLGELRIALAA